MIERFVADELDSNDYRNGINFDETLKIYTKFYQLCVSVTKNDNLSSNNEINDQVNNKNLLNLFYLNN